MDSRQYSWLCSLDGDSGRIPAIRSIRELTDRATRAVESTRSAIAARSAVVAGAFSPSLKRLPATIGAYPEYGAAERGFPGVGVSVAMPVPRVDARTQPAPQAARPAEGSMGIVHSSIGEARLQAEIAWAVAGRGTLSIIRIIATLDPSLTREDRWRAARGVARAIDCTIGEHDVAYANGPLDFVVILPGMDAAAAADVVAKIASAANVATILIGRNRRRCRFGSLGTIQVIPSTIAGRLAA